MGSLGSGVYHSATREFSTEPARRARLDRFCRARSSGSCPENDALGILCGASRAAQNCRTVSAVTLAPVGHDAGDDLLAALRVRRGHDTHVCRQPGISRRTCSTSSGCTFRPATFTNDETRPRSVTPTDGVPRAVVAGQKAAVSEAVARGIGISRRDGGAAHVNALHVAVGTKRDLDAPATGGR